MPNWKKVIVSGSNVSQLNNDGVYLRTTGDGVISSSAQLATQISGAFTAPSGGFSTRITSLETAGGTTFSSSIASRITNVETDLNTLESKTLVSSSAQLTTEFDTRYLNTSGDGVISSSAQLTTEFDTRYLNTSGDGVISSSAQIATQISGAFTQASGGFSTRITSLEGAGYVDVGTGASGSLTESQRFALWQDGNTIGGHPGFEYDTANGIIRMPDRSIRAHAVNWSTGTVSFAIASPVSSYGAVISYVFFRADAPRSAFKAGNITTAYDNAGTSVVFNETTTADFGVLTNLTTNIVVIGGIMHVQFTQTSGNSHSVSCNIDVMGI